jgi:hypothetical protein
LFAPKRVGACNRVGEAYHFYGAAIAISALFITPHADQHPGVGRAPASSFFTAAESFFRGKTAAARGRVSIPFAESIV